MNTAKHTKEKLLPDLKNMLEIIDIQNGVMDYRKITQSLRQGDVVMLRGVENKAIDNIVETVADAFHLRAELELQAGFAAVKGHRENLSKYYMTVNKRDPFACIAPHSEGGSFANMQLVSLFCYENTTDGGENVLFNLDESVDLKKFLKERVKRGKVENHTLTAGEISRIKMQYNLNLPNDLLQEDDRVLREIQSSLTNVKIIDALAMPRKTHSKILDREVCAFWSTMKSISGNLSQEFIQHLRDWGIYRESAQREGAANGPAVMDKPSNYEQVFRGKLIYRLKPGELMLLNNHTWVHSASNWSPDSGNRNIAVAIA